MTMTQLAEMETHLSNFTRLEKSAQPAWLEALRQAGIERFEKLGFPTTRDEEWRFTNVAPIARTPFKLAKAVDGAAALKAFTFGREAAVELVFINGHFNAELSRLGKQGHG